MHQPDEEGGSRTGDPTDNSEDDTFCGSTAPLAQTVLAGIGASPIDLYASSESVEVAVTNAFTLSRRDPFMLSSLNPVSLSAAANDLVFSLPEPAESLFVVEDNGYVEAIETSSPSFPRRRSLAPLDLLSGTVGTPLEVDAATALVENLVAEAPGGFGVEGSFLVATSERVITRYCTGLEVEQAP